MRRIRRARFVVACSIALLAAGCLVTIDRELIPGASDAGMPTSTDAAQYAPSTSASDAARPLCDLALGGTGCGAAEELVCDGFEDATAAAFPAWGECRRANWNGGALDPMTGCSVTEARRCRGAKAL